MYLVQKQWKNGDVNCYDEEATSEDVDVNFDVIRRWTYVLPLTLSSQWDILEI